MSKTILRHTLISKIFLTFYDTFLLSDIEHFTGIEPLLRDHLSYKATFTWSQW
jgi:hypothetical protein